MGSVGSVMAGVSPDLVWLLLKKQNKYLHKQGGDSNASVTFTTEPLNLTAKHSFKHCGKYEAVMMVDRIWQCLYTYLRIIQ